MREKKTQNLRCLLIGVFIVVNVLGILGAAVRERYYVDHSMAVHGKDAREKTETVMQEYIHSFRLFGQMMTRELEEHPEPDDIWDYLQSIDSTMLDIEGETFDGLYMYYKGRYLYSWDTPYSEYEDTGYVAAERPWYINAVKGDGKIVFTPPYMSYANHYILSTISQLQPDKETVFAYDIKMGDIQELVTSLNYFKKEQVMIYDNQGTVIGSTNPDYLGGSLLADSTETGKVLKDAKTALKEADGAAVDQREKLEEQVNSADAFHNFRCGFDEKFGKLLQNSGEMMSLKNNGVSYYGYVTKGEGYNVLTLVPVMSMLGDTLQIWLLPLLVMELLLIYIIGRITKGQRNRELQEAYVELGQTQKRLELALNAAQKAAAVDDLTGMMNFKSFRKSVTDALNMMRPDECGILIMLDGDHFKAVNDNYGHQTGDEVIKLSAQMIIGRIRTIDLASRLHGDEFAIFVSNSGDYSVARKIVDDINNTIADEAKKRMMPSITLSAGAVIARKDDNYTSLTKEADAALYEAKLTHNGNFVSVS